MKLIKFDICTFLKKTIKMESITIPIDIPKDFLISLNLSEEGLKDQFKLLIAESLFREGKTTFGKAVELSGLTRYEFEKHLMKKQIQICSTTIDEVMGDLEKLKDL